MSENNSGHKMIVFTLHKLMLNRPDQNYFKIAADTTPSVIGEIGSNSYSSNFIYLVLRKPDKK